MKSSNKQREAAGKLIKALDLTKNAEDPEETEEKLKPEMTFNPALQYFGQVVINRIVHPE